MQTWLQTKSLTFVMYWLQAWGLTFNLMEKLLLLQFVLHFIQCSQSPGLVSINGQPGVFHSNSLRPILPTV